MAFSMLGYPILLLSLLLVVSAKNENSEFAQKVRDKLDDETFTKLFNTDHDSVEQFLRALSNAEKAEADVFDTSFPSSLDDDLAVDVKKYADRCTPDSLFRVYVNAEGETLQAMNVLNDDNMDDMADGLVEYLKDAVPMVKEDNVEDAAPAISTALFKFLKSQGLASDDVLKIFTRNILNNIKKDYSDK